MRFAPFSLFRRKEAFSRAATRYACQVDCELVLTDSMVTYEGRLIDISVGGAMFRPRLAYLMSRRNEPVALRCGQHTVLGEIMATNSAGFGIRFDTPLDHHALMEMLGGDAQLAPIAA